LKILIAGDSFAAEWPGNDGWVKLLAKDYTVTNLAQAGVSEYKILKQLQNCNINNYDTVIVSHTSPSRVHTPSHPLHKHGLHKDCDLIWTDLSDRNAAFNPSLKSAKDYFRYHYDDEYYQTIYSLLRKEIYNLLDNNIYISMTHIELDSKFTIEQHHIDFNKLWVAHRGTENHYSKHGNNCVYNVLVDKIKKSAII
tara:strand:+ start:57 stop:644 length:588 start_codon:yes stop_codon:yes gene_type:complete